jgi:WhiB family transcriptional regulator, redox-sensing transcriptional regulator
MQFKRTCTSATAGHVAWQLRALCTQVDPELFFPSRAGGSEQARRVCRRCLVQAECLTDVLARDDRFGIRAGLSGRQRARLVRERRTVRAAVGSAADGGAA